jgi:hypothetical protein
MQSGRLSDGNIAHSFLAHMRPRIDDPEDNFLAHAICQYAARHRPDLAHVSDAWFDSGELVEDMGVDHPLHPLVRPAAAWFVSEMSRDPYWRAYAQHMDIRIEYILARF